MEEPMVRTQIQVSEERLKSLKRLAASKGCSIAELVRQGIDLILQGEAAAPSVLRERAASISGKFRSGRTDTSRHHDKYLADSYRK